MSQIISPPSAAATSGMRFTDWAASSGATSNTRTASNSTAGQTFLCDVACSCTGAVFYWKSSGSETVKVKLYATLSGTLLASANVAVSSDGVKTATWDAVALTPGELYTICYFNTTNSVYITTVMNANYPSMGIGTAVRLNAHLTRTRSCIGTGDINPNNGSNAIIACDPTITA